MKPFILFITLILGFTHSNFLNKKKVLLHESHFKGLNNDQANGCTELLNGDYVFVGSTQERGKKKGSMNKDAIYTVQKIDITKKKKKGDLIRKTITSYGGEENDEFRAVTNTIDGNAIIVGYTENANKRKINKNGWIIKVNPWGTIIWEKKFVNKFNSDLFDIIQLNDKSFLAVGEKKDSIWVINFDLGGINYLEKTYSNGSKKYSARAVTQSKQTLNIGITGERKGSKKAFFIELNKDLKQLSPNVEETKDITLGKDIVFHNETYYILGDQNSNYTRSDIHLLKRDTTTTRKIRNPWQKVHSFIGESDDFSSSLSLVNNVLTITGFSESWPSAEASSFNPIVLKWDGTTKEKKEADFGIRKRYGYKINKHYPTSDGGIIIAGSGIPAKGQTEEDAWFLKYIEESDTCSFNELLTLELDTFYFGNPTLEDNILNFNEQDYITVRLKNQSSTSTCGLFAYIQMDSIIDGLNIHQKVIVPNIPYEWTKTFYIPISGKVNLCSASTSIKLVIENKWGVKKIFDQKATVVTKAAKKPILKISDYKFETTNGKALNEVKRGDTLRINLSVGNYGEKEANQVTLKVKAPDQIKMIGNLDTLINILNPGEKEQVSFLLSASEFFFYEDINIGFIAYDQDDQSIDYSHATFNIGSYFQIDLEEIPGMSQFKSPNWIRRYDKGPSPYEIQNLKEDSVEENIRWGYTKFFLKESLLSDKGIKISQMVVPIKAFVTSSKKVNSNDFEFFNDETGEKYPLTEKPIWISKGTYAIFQELILRKGKNRFGIRSKRKSKLASPLITINYKPPSCHIFSVGIPYKELSTTQNADIILSKYKQLKDSNLYKKINTELDTSSLDTSYKMLKDWANKRIKNIPAQDHVLIFISAHGKFDDDFFIIPSYKNEKNYTTNDFKEFMSFKSIFAPLKELPYQQSFVILDACESGRFLEEKRQTALDKTHNNLGEQLSSIDFPKTFNILTASDNIARHDTVTKISWLTEALLYALDRKKFQIGRRYKTVDQISIDDGYISIIELFTFIDIYITEEKESPNYKQNTKLWHDEALFNSVFIFEFFQ